LQCGLSGNPVPEVGDNIRKQAERETAGLATAGACLGKPAGPKPQYLPVLLSLTLSGCTPPRHSFRGDLFLMSSKKSSVSVRYAFIVGATSFILTVAFFWLSDILAIKLKSLLLSFLFLVIIILTGVLADIIGTSVTVATEAPFHAKGAKKVPGAQEGIFLIRNADRVANICNDVVGDIAGTLSGAMGIALVLQIIIYWSQGDQLLINMLMTGTITAVTVSSKAMGKRLAVRHANEIIFLVAKVLAAWTRLTGLPVVKKTRRTGSRKP